MVTLFEAVVVMYVSVWFQFVSNDWTSLQIIGIAVMVIATIYC